MRLKWECFPGWVSCSSVPHWSGNSPNTGPTTGDIKCLRQHSQNPHLAWAPMGGYKMDRSKPSCTTTTAEDWRAGWGVPQTQTQTQRGSGPHMDQLLCFPKANLTGTLAPPASSRTSRRCTASMTVGLFWTSSGSLVVHRSWFRSCGSRYTWAELLPVKQNQNQTTAVGLFTEQRGI